LGHRNRSDLRGFGAANDLDGKSDHQARAAIGVLLPMSCICDQQRWRNPSLVESSIILMSDDGLKTTVTFPTLPKMTNVAVIPMLGPFGGDQLIAATEASHPEARTTCGCYRGHGNIFPVSLPVSRRSNVITAKSLL
jgi:hypothetical protein